MKRHRLFFRIVSLFVWLAWPAPGWALHTWKKERLPNGLTVVVVEEPDTPVVSVTLLVKHGTTSEPPEKRGVASLTGRLLTEGTRRRSGEQIAGRIAALGGEFVGDVSFDDTTLAWAVLKEDVTPAVEVLADLVQHPVFPPAEVERARHASLSARQAKTEKTPEAFVLRHFFGTGPYGVPASGAAASRERIVRADVVRFYRQMYRPEATVLIAAGDVTVEAITALAKKYFGTWRASAKTTDSLPALPVTREPAALVVNRPLAQANVRLAFVGAPAADPHTPALRLLSRLLAGSPESRLERTLREQHGWTYDVWSDLESFRQTGLFFISMSVPYEVVLPALEETIRAIVRLQTEPVSAAELARAKQELTVRFYFATENVRTVSRFLAEHEAFTQGQERPDHVVDALSGVTAEEVQRVARTYLDPRRAVVTVVGDARAVSQYAPVLTQGKLPQWPQADTRDRPGAGAPSTWTTPGETTGVQEGRSQ